MIINENILVKIIGYPATIFHGDAAVFNRWWWPRKHIVRGNPRTLEESMRITKTLDQISKSIKN